MNALKSRTRQNEIDANNLIELLDEYIADCFQRLKKHSANNYRLSLEPFRIFWNEDAPARNFKLDRQTFVRFDHWLGTDYRNCEGKKASAWTKGRTARVLGQFCTWLYQEGCTEFDLSSWVIRRRAEPVAQYWPSNADLQKMFDCMPAGQYRLRDSATLAFLLATGCRRMEVAAMTVENVHFDTPITNLDVGANHGGWVQLDVAKNGKPRVVVFCSKAGLLLKCWMRTANITKGIVFGLGDTGLRLSLLHITDAAHIPEMTPHAARRAFMDHYADHHKGDLLAYTIGKLQMGHAIGRDVTAAHYINLQSASRVLERLRAYYVSPLDDIHFDWNSFPVHIPTKDQSHEQRNATIVKAMELPSNGGF